MVEPEDDTDEEVTVIQRKDAVLKDTKIEWNIFKGYCEYPIYKHLAEIDKEQLSQYNDKNILYVYNPNHLHGDDNGIHKYKLLGVTYRRTQKRTLLIVKNMDTRAIFKQIYLQIEGDKVIDCGHVFPDTLEQFKGVEIGETYKGYRNATWQKLDKSKFKDVLGKVYELKRV